MWQTCSVSNRLLVPWNHLFLFLVSAKECDLVSTSVTRVVSIHSFFFLKKKMEFLFSQSLNNGLTVHSHI